MTGGYRKIKLFSLMVALVVAGLAVVGGTWAWGVNYDVQAGTKIDDGDNDRRFSVDMQYYVGNEYTSAVDVGVFSDAAWCPGKTEIVYLKLENHEKFPVNCTLTLNVSGNQFENVMSCAYILNKDLKDPDVDHPDNWKEFYTEANMEPIIIQDGDIPLLSKYTLSFADTAGDDYYLALAVHMDESASSDYMGRSMNIHLKLQVDANYEPGFIPENPDTSDVDESQSKAP